jgi:UDP-N-acetylglucosamine 2-epimerase (non-hydrolysing)
MSKLIVHVVGARPNFVKAAPVINSINDLDEDIEQLLIHTGQHYDKNLSEVFFSALKMPKPDVNLKIGSSRMQAKQVAEVMIGIEEFLQNKKVDMLVVYGDVNSTLGATLAAAKMKIKVAHVESGLRSFDRDMPEEVNRTIVDNISDFLFVTEYSTIQNLLNEGKNKEDIYFVGNTMIDSLYNVLPLLGESEEVDPYILLTLHRPSNVDNMEGLQRILDICSSINFKMIFPIHPRTKNSLGKFGLLDELKSIENVKLIEPVGYFEFVKLMRDSMLVLTDSGGIQEETTALGVPCLTLRRNTERPSTIKEGSNRLVDNVQQIQTAIAGIKSKKNIKYSKPHLWDGKSGARIATIIKDKLRDK